MRSGSIWVAAADESPAASDVGSGKTLVGLLSMLLAIDNHCQACMMAPTEILATQHYATIMGFLKDMDVKVALLTGSTKKKERDKILPAIASGEIQIVIGTHALIEEKWFSLRWD